MILLLLMILNTYAAESPCGQLTQNEYCINLRPTKEEITLYCKDKYEKEIQAIMITDGITCAQDIQVILDQIEGLGLVQSEE